DRLFINVAFSLNQFSSAVLGYTPSPILPSIAPPTRGFGWTYPVAGAASGSLLDPPTRRTRYTISGLLEVHAIIFGGSSNIGTVTHNKLASFPNNLCNLRQ